jgi:energy-coupling factor transporter ATP-binding protein EcfA2
MLLEARKRLACFGVQPDDPHLACGALSGGNLQKLVLARELSQERPLLVAVNPTASLDLVAADATRGRLRSYAASGGAVVLVSFDLQELSATADRILVLFDGEVAGTELTESLSAQSLGLLMGGIRAKVATTPSAEEGAPGSDAASDLRVAVISLLNSGTQWQRTLAAQLSLRVFGPADTPILRNRLIDEDHEATIIWLSIALAKVGGRAALQELIEAFELNPFGFVEAQRVLVESPDHASLRNLLNARRYEGLADWEVVLGMLAAEHLGVQLDRDLKDAVAARDIDSALHHARRPKASDEDRCQ